MRGRLKQIGCSRGFTFINLRLNPHYFIIRPAADRVVIVSRAGQSYFNFPQSHDPNRPEQDKAYVFLRTGKRLLRHFLF